MSLPTDFSRELPREIAERAPQPGFDAVVDRAHTARRRRRTTIASGLAAAVVVAGVGFGASRLPGPDASPGPATPAPSRPTSTVSDGTSEVDTRLPADVQDVLGRTNLHPWAVAGTGDGTAVLWRGCLAEGPGDAPCDVALVTRVGDTVTGEVLPAPLGPRLSPTPGGWLLETGDAFELLGTDGSRENVVDTGPGNEDAMPGDTVVETSSGPRILRGTKLVDVPGAGGWKPSGAYVAPDGRLVLAPTVAGPRRVIITEGDLQWEMTHVADDAADSVGTGLLAGNGDHLAYVLLGDAPDGSIPILHVALSSDAGDTWTVARGLERSVYQDVSGLAVSRQGTAYIVTGSHGLIRVDTDGNEVNTPMSPHDMGVFTSGDEVCVVAEGDPVDELQCSDDDGTSWAPQPLPGFS